MIKRHRFHSICPYFAMFPETFAAKHLAASRHKGTVFDPFCGRGTTLFEALLSNRESAGCDLNPVAICISGAKCNPPSYQQAISRLEELEAAYCEPKDDDWAGEWEEFFDRCFSKKTLKQVRYLRSALKWKVRKDDRFIAAVALGALHGESHRSAQYFSNRMPRTISTKPGYSIRWWKLHKYDPPKRDVFTILRHMIAYRFASQPPSLKGKVALSDARKAASKFDKLKGKVTDVITSPPYLDTTNYKEDQWLRLWFLGHPPVANYPREDSRHTDKDLYWQFLTETWSGINPLLANKARLAIRIGGRRIPKSEARAMLLSTLKIGTDKNVRLLDEGVTSEILSSQANSFRGNRVEKGMEHDFCFSVFE